MYTEHLKSLLAKCFKYNRYAEAVAMARNCVSEDAYYRDNWEGIKQIIKSRSIGPASAYDFFTASANLVLDENSDEKVYRWLDLMVENLEDPSGEVTAYR